MNILIKLMSIVSLVIAPHIAVVRPPQPATPAPPATSDVGQAPAQPDAPVAMAR
jgi:hypothetical protein